MEMEVVGDYLLLADVFHLVADVYPLVVGVYLPVGVCSGVVVHSNSPRQRHRLRSIGDARLVVAEGGFRRTT